MSNLVPPHGADSLQPLLLPEIERAEEMQRAGRLKQVALSSREVSDLFMLGMGAYTPLDGFMGEADWRGCCENMQRADGLFWPIPITLSCTKELGDSIAVGEDVTLVDGETGELLGVLTVTEKYAIARRRRGRCSWKRAGQKWRPSRRATRCTAATSIWQRLPSRSASAC